MKTRPNLLPHDSNRMPRIRMWTENPSLTQCPATPGKSPRARILTQCPIPTVNGRVTDFGVQSRTVDPVLRTWDKGARHAPSRRRKKRAAPRGAAEFREETSKKGRRSDNVG